MQSSRRRVELREFNEHIEKGRHNVLCQAAGVHRIGSCRDMSTLREAFGENRPWGGEGNGSARNELGEPPVPSTWNAT